MKNSNFLSKFNFVGVVIALLFVLFYCPTEAVAQAGTPGGGHSVGLAPCDFAENCKKPGKTYKCVSQVSSLTDLINNTTLLPPTQALNSPQYIIINDDVSLVILPNDPEYTFNNCHIIMGENAQIVFLGSNTMKRYTFEGTTVEACSGKRWNDIQIGNNVVFNAISSTFNNSKLAALHVFGNNTSLFVSGSSFNNNAVGVAVHSGSNFFVKNSSSKLVCNATIVGNTFSNNDLGVYLANVLQFYIGHDYRAKNTFESVIGTTTATIGVFAEQVNNLTIRNSTFKNMNVGVWAEQPLGTSGSSNPLEQNCNLYQDGKDILSFDNCNIGINIGSYSSAITNNQMKVNKIGIQSFNHLDAPLLRNAYFSRNFITSKFSGISFSSTNSTARIINNEVTMILDNLQSTTTPFGISLDGLGNDELINVLQNVVSMPNNASTIITGIEATQVRKLIIKSNTIRNPSGDLPSNIKGISITSCNSPSVINNNVYGSGSANEGIGYYLENSMRGLISCNYSNKLNHGFQFSEFNDNASFQKNTIREANIGLKLDFGDQGNTIGVMGQQKNNRNTWPIGTVAPSLEAGADVGDGKIENSRFYLTSVAPSSLLAEPRFPATGWFEEGSQTPTVPLSSCVFFEYEEPQVFGEDGTSDPVVGFSAMETDFLVGTYIFNQPVFEWDFKYNLWKHLHKNPIVKNSLSQAVTFYNNNTSNNLGSLATVDIQLANIYSTIGCIFR